MRETFVKYRKLLVAARRWEKAQGVHALAAQRRDDDIRELAAEGIAAEGIAKAFALSLRRVYQIISSKPTNRKAA